MLEQLVVDGVILDKIEADIGNSGDQQFAVFVSQASEYLGFAASTMSN